MAGKTGCLCSNLRLLIDVQYLISQLSSLEGLDGPGNHLEVCVNNMKIKDRRTNTTQKNPQSIVKPNSGQSSQSKSNFAYSFGKMINKS